MGGHVVAPGVFGGEHPAVLPGEHVIILQFQPPKSLIVHVGKAQHSAEKLSLRIDPFGVLPNLNARRAVSLTPAPHCVRFLTVHSAGQQAVVGAALAEFCQCLLIINVQYFRERLRRRLHQCIGQLPRGGPDGPAGLAGGQHGTVRGINLAPGGGQSCVPQLLVGGAGRVDVRVQNLQPVQPHQQSAKTDQRQHRRHQPGAAAHVAVLLRRDDAFVHGPPPPCPSLCRTAAGYARLQTAALLCILEPAR